MLKSQEFEQLNYPAKKQTLIDMFSQLNDETNSFEDTIFLLNASNQIKNTTLNQIYKDLSDLLQHTKDLSQEKYLQRLSIIQKKIQKDTEQESAEADSLLDNI
jgi:hypothetical protein